MEADRDSDDMQKIGRWNSTQADEYLNRVIQNLYDNAEDSETKETLKVLLKMEVV